MSGSDVTLTTSIDLDKTYDISLSAFSFDPPMESKVEYEYDNYRNLTKITDADGNEASFSYNSEGLTTSSTDFENNSTNFTYDVYGNVDTVTAPVGSGSDTATIQFVYDDAAHSDVVQIIDSNNESTHFDYDNKGRLKTITFPEGGAITYFYDLMDNVTKIRDAKGQDVVKYKYDLLNRLAEKTYSTGAKVEYAYNNDGTVQSVTDPRGNVTTFHYYDNNWLKSVTFPDGNVVSYQYNESGDLTEVTLPDGNQIQYEYYLDHSLYRVTLPDGADRKVFYDTYGNIKKLTDGRGNYAEFSYDALQQLQKTILPLQGADKVTSYEYNKNGDVTKITDARGNDTDFTYDKAGRISRIDYPDSTYETFTYDGVGNLTQHTDGRGKTTQFQYDGDDRLTRVILPDSDGLIEYQYDLNGNVTKRTDPDHSIALYQYDSHGRLSDVHQVDEHGRTISRHRFAYDFTGALTEFAEMFGHRYGVGYEYGGAHTLGRDGGEPYDHKYKFGQLKYGGAIKPKYGEMSLGEPGEIIPGQTNVPGRYKYGEGKLSSAFSYDNLGRLTEYTDYFSNKYYYGYDKLGRMALVQYPNGLLTTYAYDDAGRLETIAHRNGSPTGAVIKSFTYTYDGNGNITRITNADNSYTDYTYDQWNRLTSEHWQDAAGETLYRAGYSFTTAGADKYGDTGNICSKTEIGRAEAWWDDDWDYKVKTTVTNNTGAPLDNFQVKIQLDTASLITAGKMQPDGDDIRVLDGSEVSPLGFWLDPDTINTASTDVWIKFPSLAKGDNICYIYYGNNAAESQSNGDDTFEVFDDFSGGALTKWEPYQSETIPSNPVTAQWSVSGGVLAQTADLSSETDPAYVVYNDDFNLEDYTVEFKARKTSGNFGFWLMFPVGDVICRWNFANASWGGDIRAQYIDGTAMTHNLATNHWYYARLKVLKSIDRYVGYAEDLDDAWNDDFDVTDTTVTGFTDVNNLSLAAFTCNAEFDYIRIRKAVVTEPTASVGSEISKPATPQAKTTSYTYDSYNKLLGITYSDGATETLTYDNNGQLTKREKTTGEVATYEWNNRGQLVKVTLPSGEPVEYNYDGAGRLVGRTSTDGEDVFVQSGWSIVKEMQNIKNGKRIFNDADVKYHTGMSSVDGNGDESTRRFYHYNHRGDTALITDQNGSIINSFNYAAYGKVFTDDAIPMAHVSTKDNPNLFVGAYGIRYDGKTNLHYMRFRWYSEDIMRFIRPDFLLTENMYQYVSSRPINFTDPLGLVIHLGDNAIIIDENGNPVLVSNYPGGNYITLNEASNGQPNIFHPWYPTHEDTQIIYKATLSLFHSGPVGKFLVTMAAGSGVTMNTVMRNTTNARLAVIPKGRCTYQLLIRPRLLKEGKSDYGAWKPHAEDILMTSLGHEFLHTFFRELGIFGNNANVYDELFAYYYQATIVNYLFQSGKIPANFDINQFSGVLNKLMSQNTLSEWLKTLSEAYSYGEFSFPYLLPQPKWLNIIKGFNPKCR